MISDVRPQPWDQALHLTYSYIYSVLLKSLRLADIVKVSNYYPPFFHLSAVPLYVFGFSEDVAILVNVFYFILLVLSVFGIAREIWSEKEGLLAAIVVSFSPMLLKMQREFMLDFAFTSLVTSTLYFFIKSRTFREFKYSILFGLFFGFTQLTKWNAPIFIVPFVISYVYFDFFSGKYCPYCGAESDGFCSKAHKKAYTSLKGRVAMNAAVALLLAFFVAAWWYIPNLKTVLLRLSYFANIGGKEGDPSFLTPEGWIYYLRALDVSMGLFFAVLSAIGVAYLLKVERDKHSLSLTIAIFAGYVVLTILSNKNIRYVLPLIPLVSIVAARFLSITASKLDRRIVLAALLVIGLLNLSSTTLGYPDFGEPYVFGHPERPVSEDWKIEEVLDTIASHSRGGEVVLALADHPYYNGQSLEYYRITGGYRFTIYNGVYLPYRLVVQNFDKISFVIVIEPREHGGVYGEIEKKLYDLFYSKKGEFKLIGSFELPDNSSVFVYKRN